MKTLAVLFLAFITLPISCFTQANYKHKSEEEIARMTPAQRVEEMVKEKIYHSEPDGDDSEQPALIQKYIRKDGVKALPAIADIANQYSPKHAPGKYGYELVRMHVAFDLASDIDSVVIRIRATNEGRAAIKAFEGVVDRLKKFDPDGTLYGEMYHGGTLREFWHTWSSIILSGLQGKSRGLIDSRIRTTLREKHKIKICGAELTRFSNYLTSTTPTYPSRCKTSPSFPSVCKDSKEYYEAYLRFIKEDEKNKSEEITDTGECYEHKPEDEIAKMGPAERIEELVKEEFYHRSFHDQESILRDYILKDGVKALKALADIADKYDSNNPSDFELHRVFQAFHLARDIDNVAVRIRGTKEGRRLIKAIEGVLDRMKKTGHDNKKLRSYQRYIPGELERLRTLQGKDTSPTDANIRKSLRKKHNIQISNEGMIRFSDYLTSLDPLYPSRCKTQFGACKDSKEYYDAYLRFKADVAFNGFCSTAANISEFNEVDRLASFPKLETERAKQRFMSFSDKIQINISLIGSLCQDGGSIGVVGKPPRFATKGEELLISRGQEVVGAISVRMTELKQWNALNSLSEFLVEIDRDCKCLGNNPSLLRALKKVFDHPPKISDRFDKDYFDEFRSNISRLNINDSQIKSKLVAK